MNEIVFDICRITATIIGLALAYYIIPALKTMVKEHMSSNAIEFIRLCVHAAEQIYRNAEKSGNIKKKYVEERVSAWLNDTGISISAEEIDILIESAVHAMNAGTN